MACPIDAVQASTTERFTADGWVRILENKLAQIINPRLQEVFAFHGMASSKFVRPPFVDGLLATLLEMRARHRLQAKAATDCISEKQHQSAGTSALTTIEQHLLPRSGAHCSSEDSTRACALCYMIISSEIKNDIATTNRCGHISGSNSRFSFTLHCKTHAWEFMTHNYEIALTHRFILVRTCARYHAAACRARRSYSRLV